MDRLEVLISPRDVDFSPTPDINRAMAYLHGRNSQNHHTIMRALPPRSKVNFHKRPDIGFLSIVINTDPGAFRKAFDSVWGLVNDMRNYAGLPPVQTTFFEIVKRVIANRPTVPLNEFIQSCVFELDRTDKYLDLHFSRFFFTNSKSAIEVCDVYLGFLIHLNRETQMVYNKLVNPQGIPTGAGPINPDFARSTSRFSQSGMNPAWKNNTISPKSSNSLDDPFADDGGEEERGRKRGFDSVYDAAANAVPPKPVDDGFLPSKKPYRNETIVLNNTTSNSSATTNIPPTSTVVATQKKSPLSDDGPMKSSYSLNEDAAFTAKKKNLLHTVWRYLQTHGPLPVATLIEEVRNERSGNTMNLYPQDIFSLALSFPQNIILHTKGSLIFVYGGAKPNTPLEDL